MPEEKKIPQEQKEPGSRIPDLLDRRTRPEGSVPKQSQTYVIVGLAVVILLAVMFSNNRAKPTAKQPPAGAAAISTDANQRKIEELKQDLSEEQKRGQQAQYHAQADTINATPPQANQPLNAGYQPVTTSPPPTDPVKDAERALNFKARFASNPVGINSATAAAAAQSPSTGGALPELSSALSTLSSQVPTSTPSPRSETTAKPAAEVNVNSAAGQPYVLFEGTMLDTALVNRLDGEFAGPVKVMVTNPVYSQDRQHVLIPEGTFLLGGVQKVSGFGQKRLAVTFHRMLMPDGYSVDLDQFHGLDTAGESGLKDKVNNHYLQIFGTSIALGVIAGAAESTTNSGYNENGWDAYRQGMAASLSQSSANVLDRFINIQPTITIREGHRVKVYFTQDLLLPAFENHTVPPNI